MHLRHARRPCRQRVATDARALSVPDSSQSQRWSHRARRRGEGGAGTHSSGPEFRLERADAGRGSDARRTAAAAPLARAAAAFACAGGTPRARASADRPAGRRPVAPRPGAWRFRGGAVARAPRRTGPARRPASPVSGGAGKTLGGGSASQSRWMAGRGGHSSAGLDDGPGLRSDCGGIADAPPRPPGRPTAAGRRGPGPLWHNGEGWRKP